MRLLVHEDCFFVVGVLGAFEVVAFTPLRVPAYFNLWTRSLGGAGMSSEELLNRLAVECRGVDNMTLEKTYVWVEGWDRWSGVPGPIPGAREFVPWMRAAVPLAQAERASREVCHWVELKPE